MPVFCLEFYIIRDSFLSILLTSWLVRKVIKPSFGTMMLLGLMRRLILRQLEMGKEWWSLILDRSSKNITRSRKVLKELQRRLETFFITFSRVLPREILLQETIWNCIYLRLDMNLSKLSKSWEKIKKYIKYKFWFLIISFFS